MGAWPLPAPACGAEQPGEELMSTGRGHVSDVERLERLRDDWSRRDFLRRLGGAAALSAVTAGGMGLLEACSGSPQPAPAGGGPRRGGHLIEGATSVDPNSLNPFFISSVTDARWSSLLFSNLVDWAPDGTLVPTLAAAVPRAAADQVTYTIQLRPGLLWSDRSEE